MINFDKLKELKSVIKIKNEADLMVDRNKWFSVTILLGFIILILLFQLNQANKRASNNLQVAWVKLHPQGSWNVDLKTVEQEIEFFPSTINYLIRQFVENRYSKNTTSIATDYGRAQFLMSPKMRDFFLSSKGGDAISIAKTYQGSTNLKDEIAEVRYINHYDESVSKFGAERGTLYYTNVFITMSILSPDGKVLNSSEKIVSLQWRIKHKKEIMQDIELLKYNPIGLEILRADLLEDPSEN